jgi:hypothetical protein
MFATDPDMYYLNHSFQVKMVCLLLAIVIHYTIRRKAISNGTAGRGIACISLALWVFVLAGGIFTGFFV